MRLIVRPSKSTVPAWAGEVAAAAAGGRLAAARLADQAEGLAPVDREVDAGHGRHVADRAAEHTAPDREVLDQARGRRAAARRRSAGGGRRHRGVGHVAPRSSPASPGPGRSPSRLRSMTPGWATPPRRSRRGHGVELRPSAARPIPSTARPRRSRRPTPQRLDRDVGQLLGAVAGRQVGVAGHQPQRRDRRSSQIPGTRANRQRGWNEQPGGGGSATAADPTIGTSGSSPTSSRRGRQASSPSV